jgi:SAM-dependent methyltransferase
MVFGKRLFAATYDAVNRRWEEELEEHRRRTVAPVRGRVLELGGGTGANLPFYPDGVELTVVEPNPHMARRLEEKAEELDREVRVVGDKAEALSFADASFDFVVSTMMLCSVADVEAATREARRVLCPGGAHAFFEHIRAPGWKGAAQRAVNPIWGLFTDGCNIQRDILGAFERSGFGRLEIVDRFDVPRPRLANPHVIGLAWADSTSSPGTSRARPGA